MNERMGGTSGPNRGKATRPATGPSNSPPRPSSPPPALFMPPAIPESRSPLSEEAPPAEEAPPIEETPLVEAAPETFRVTPPRPRTSDQAQAAAEAATAPSITPSLFARILNRPGHAVELLALAAVDQFADEAAATTRWLRDRYPTATPDALVRMAQQRLRNQAGLAAVGAAVLGPLAGAAEAVVQLALGARLSLFLAAAYGRDLADRPARAAELLALTGIHPSLDAARAAVAEAVGGPADAPARSLTSLPMQAAAWRMAGRLLAKRLPGLGVVTAVLSARNTIDDLTRRTRTR